MVYLSTTKTISFTSFKILTLLLDNKLMIKKLKRLLQILSKKISRKNLDKFTDYYISKISDELDGIDSVKVLNVGAGGNIETYLKTKFDFVRSIDVDVKRDPDQVIDVCDLDQLRDVQAARADMVRSKNEAEAYANDVIPRARGDAAKILQEAEAYKKQVVAAAEGEASRFLAIYNEYAKAKQVTQERMYLETMERVLADIDKVIIDRKAGGVVPYLPLPELTKKKGSDTE